MDGDDTPGLEKKQIKGKGNAMKFNMEESVTRAEALRLMKEHWQFAPEREVVSLEEALGRVTAEAVYSKNTLPVFRASCFDGVAVRSADFKDGMPDPAACLAMGGVEEVPVLRRIRVIFIPTGSELVPPGRKPARGQNVETNGLMLRRLLSGRGAEVVCVPIVPDDAGKLEKALDEALLTADLVLINGGSSRGEEDFNSHLLKRRSSFFRHGVRAVPGRPVGFAIVEGKPVVNIPGPVAAAYLAEHWCLSALVSHWYGLPDPQYPLVKARLESPVRKRLGFELISRVSLLRTADGYRAVPLDWGEDGIPGLLRNTDGFLNIPADISGLSAGETVEVELLKSPELIRRESGGTSDL